MHPEWLKTSGLSKSLPLFSKLIGKWLRELEDGTDTILWLLITEESLKSGEFYFDRKIVTHYLSKKYNLTLDQIAYIGDDLNDLDTLKIVGLSAMPPTSPILDLITPDIITNNRGGDGAFRNLADIILKAQNII